jgi:hypothetical protein
VDPGETCKKRLMVCRYSWFWGALRSRLEEFGSKKKRMSLLSSGSPSSAACVDVRIGAMAIFCSENGLRFAIASRDVVSMKRAGSAGFLMTLP